MFDHIDGDTRNNLISNIRTATMAQNGRNKRKTRRRNTVRHSSYNGVHWNSRKRKWHVQVTIDGIRHYVGLYEADKELEAATAHDEYLLDQLGADGILEGRYNYNFAENCGISEEPNSEPRRIEDWVRPPKAQLEMFE